MVWASVIKEAGYVEALLGLGLSFGKTSKMTIITDEQKIIDLMAPIAKKLADKDGGHNKFLRQIGIWADMTCPFFLWKQIDTYKVGTTAQSESSMHTLMAEPITQMNFEERINDEYLSYLEALRKTENFDALNNSLPQGWLQRRIVSMNYAVVRNMVLQRKKHKLEAWRVLLRGILSSVEHPELLPTLD